MKYLTKELGYRQSIVDPCLFFLDKENLALVEDNDDKDSGSIDGIVALATDDLLHGGSQRHLDRMETLRKRYTLGKYTWGHGRFVGKDFTPAPDSSIRIDQEFYVKARVQEIQVNKERKRRKYSQCTPLKIEQLRTLGTLAWVAKETRADLAGKVALVQQAFPRPMIRDIIMANTIAKEALASPQLGIRVMPIPLERLRAGVVTDAAWGNAREFGQYLISRTLRLIGGKNYQTNGSDTTEFPGSPVSIQLQLLTDPIYMTSYQIDGQRYRWTTTRTHFKMSGHHRPV